MNDIKVLIAEDEPPIQRFVQMVVEEMPGFRVCGVCCSGEEGLACFARERPDVLITDIRMPGMSGLALIREARALNPSLFAIVISGYKLFEYAKEAIDLEATAYILKPIRPDELRGILASIQETYAKKHISRERESLQAAFRRQDEEAFFQALPGESMRLLAVYYGNAPEEMHLLGAEISETTLSIVHKNWTFFLQRNEEGDGRLRAIADNILALPGRRKTCACVQIANIPSNGAVIETLRGLYQHTLRQMIVPGKTIKASFAQLPQQGAESPVEDGEAKNRIRIDISANDMKRLQADFFALFALWAQSQAKVIHIRAWMHEMATLLRKQSLLTAQSIAFNEGMDEIIWQGDSFAEIRDNLWMEIEDGILSGCTGDDPAGRNEKMLFEQISSLLEKNPEQNMSLQSICDKFHVSPPYVRKIFRIYTGKTYKAYQLEWKIQLARQLMDGNPALRVSEVAEKIGFEPLYFGTVFNKYTGMTPSQYKAQRSSKDE